MRASLVISGFAHAAVIAWASLSFPDAKQFEVPALESLPVDIVQASELSKLKAGSREALKKEQAAGPAPETRAEPEKKKEAKPQERKLASLPPEPARQPEAPKSAIPAPPPPRAEREAEAEPAPEPKPQPQPKEEAEPRKAEKPAEPPPLPAVRPAYTPPKPEEQERKFEPDRIAALLNKLPEQSGGQTGRQDPLDLTSRGDSRGLDETMSLSELDALRQQIQRCWSPPVGIRGAEDMVVRIEMELNRDGSIRGEPRMLSTGSGLGFEVASDAARRAVLRCQPYDLPQEKYDAWQRVKMNFDPRQMLGG